MRTRVVAASILALLLAVWLASARRRPSSLRGIAGGRRWTPRMFPALFAGVVLACIGLIASCIRSALRAGRLVVPVGLAFDGRRDRHRRRHFRPPRARLLRRVRGTDGNSRLCGSRHPRAPETHPEPKTEATPAGEMSAHGSLEGYTLPKGPKNVTPWRARSRSRSLFTRSTTCFATASGSHTFAVAASSSGIGVRPVATSSRNALRSASARESTALEGHSLVDPPRKRNSRRKSAPKVGSSIVLPRVDG